MQFSLQIFMVSRPISFCVFPHFFSDTSLVREMCEGNPPQKELLYGEEFRARIPPQRRTQQIRHHNANPYFSKFQAISPMAVLANSDRFFEVSGFFLPFALKRHFFPNKVRFFTF